MTVLNSLSVSITVKYSFRLPQALGVKATRSFSNVSANSESQCIVNLDIVAAPWYTNPQTAAFCSMLGIENKINPSSSA